MDELEASATGTSGEGLDHTRRLDGFTTDAGEVAPSSGAGWKETATARRGGRRDAAASPAGRRWRGAGTPTDPPGIDDTIG